MVTWNYLKGLTDTIAARDARIAELEKRLEATERVFIRRDCSAGLSDCLNSASYLARPYGEDPKEFAKQLATETFGEEHVADLDWDNCVIIDD